MMALITALVIPFFMSTLLSTSALVPSNERWKVSSLSSKSSKRSSCLSMRFSCSSPLLSSMIRMLINVSLAVCSNLSISRLITHTPRPFCIIKIPRLFRGLKKQSQFLHLMVLFLKFPIRFHTVLQFHLIHQLYEFFDLLRSEEHTSEL